MVIFSKHVWELASIDQKVMSVAKEIIKFQELAGDTDEKDHEQFFPARLHGLIEMLEKDGLSYICSFRPHGRAFLVHDKKRFEELLPK
jgi:hypothetical protein